MGSSTGTYFISLVFDAQLDTKKKGAVMVGVKYMFYSFYFENIYLINISLKDPARHLDLS